MCPRGVNWKAFESAGIPCSTYHEMNNMPLHLAVKKWRAFWIWLIFKISTCQYLTSSLGVEFGSMGRWLQLAALSSFEAHSTTQTTSAFKHYHFHMDLFQSSYLHIIQVASILHTIYVGCWVWASGSKNGFPPGIRRHPTTQKGFIHILFEPWITPFWIIACVKWSVQAKTGKQWSTIVVC